MSTKSKKNIFLRWMVLTISGVFLLSTVPVHAQSVDSCQASQECAALDSRAIGYFEAQNYARALIDFQSAYGLSREPRLLVNIGRCFHRLGRPEEAVRYYERAQQEVREPPPEMTALLQRYLAEARAVLLAEHEVAPKALPRPLYRRPWLWGVVGTVAVTIAVGAGLGLALRVNEPPTVLAEPF